MKYKQALACFSVALMLTIAASSSGQTPIKVTGLVFDPGAYPVSGARVTLYSLDRISQTTSDSAGHFQFDAVPSGEYELEVRSQGFKMFKQIYVADSTRTPNKTIDLTISLQMATIGGPVIVMAWPEVSSTADCGPRDAVTYESRKIPEAAGLSGMVINRYPKEPVAGASLDLIDANGARIAHQQTNARGEFQFKPTPPGRYHLVFQHAGYHDKTAPEFWIARENVTNITLQAEQPGTNVVCK